MYSRVDRPSTRACIAAIAVSCTTVGACARPSGPLFEPITPPMIWPAPPDSPRIQLLGLLAGSDDLNAAQSSGEVFRAVLRGPRPPIRFSGPHAVAIQHPGLIAVADASGSAVHIINLNERSQTVTIGWKDERLGTPVGVAWIGQRLFVTDARRGEVIEFDVHGVFRRRFGGDSLKRPVGIAYVERRNQLYVVDGGRHQLVVFDTTGERVRTLGGPGSEPGRFNYPTHICAADDRLVVSDTGNFRVQLLDLDGRCLRTIGGKGDGAGDFSLPKGVAFDRDGHIYVVDAQFENVQVFDIEGRLLMAFGSEGASPGRFSLPAGLAIDEQNRIWVAEAGNRRIQVFQRIKS